MHKPTLFLAAAAFASACSSPHHGDEGHPAHETRTAVAEARLPLIRYYAIADT